MKKQNETQEELLCKVMKIDPKTWKLETSDSSSSLIAELNLKERRFNFNYLGKEPKKDDCTVKVGIDRQKNVLELQYQGKDDNGSLRTLSLGLPLGGATFSIESREVIKSVESPELTPLIPERKIKETKPIETQEHGKTRAIFEGDGYRTSNSVKFIPMLKELLENGNTVKKSKILEKYPDHKTRIGMMLYLSALERRGLVTEDKKKKEVIYNFSEGSKSPKHVRKDYGKEGYPALLAGMLTEDDKISVSDIDKAFQDGLKRRSVKLFITQQYLNKNLATKDPSGTFYTFNPGVLIKPTSN
jgi:hypothetical protein